MTDFQKHSAHSRMVSGWRHRRTGSSLFGLKQTQGTCHQLRSPHDGFLVAVYFTELEDDQEHMIVRSTNWRCEDEPSGIFTREQCREFWRQLADAGFVAFAE